MTIAHQTEANPASDHRVVLLMSPATYRAAAFLEAAERLGIVALPIVDMPNELREYWHEARGVNFADIHRATDEVVAVADRARTDAVLSVDDSATELAAHVNSRLGLIHNDPESALAARDKFVMRRTLASRGVRCPAFETVSAATDPDQIATRIAYPCVVKPLRLSGSRGVIRANDPQEFSKAFKRLGRILQDDGADLATTQILIEEYLPGVEVALEGLLTDGNLRVLALFDKPDPLEGPFFEETIYVTPSRLPDELQQAIANETASAASALGLRHGSIHAELRINERGPWLLEVAGRSIGGLCSTILSFGSGITLEEMILRHAVGMTIESFDREGSAAGVMMIPIPRAGMLRNVEGVEEAQRVPHIEGIEITAKLNYPILPLPEGSSYLGFIFARGDSPEAVEEALREAHSRLTIRIDPMVRMASSQQSVLR